MKFVVLLALAIVGLAAIAVFATEGENGTASKSDYLASSSEPFGTSKHRLP